MLLAQQKRVFDFDAPATVENIRMSLSDPFAKKVETLKSTFTTIISYFRQMTQPHRQIHHGLFDCRVKYFIAIDTSGIIRYDSYHFNTM